MIRYAEITVTICRSTNTYFTDFIGKKNVTQYYAIIEL